MASQFTIYISTVDDFIRDDGTKMMPFNSCEIHGKSEDIGQLQRDTEIICEQIYSGNKVLIRREPLVDVQKDFLTGKTLINSYARFWFRRTDDGKTEIHNRAETEGLYSFPKKE